MPGQYRIATAPADRTKLRPQRLRRIVDQFARCPNYQLAAAAGGINRQTLAAWRARGRPEVDLLPDEVLDQILTLRDPETAPDGRRLSWEDIERAVGIHISMFTRLVLSLEAAKVAFANERIAIIAQAARGRQRVVEGANRALIVEDVAPTSTAAAWLLERSVDGFSRHRREPSEGEAEVDSVEGYRSFREEFDRIAGYEPCEGKEE